MKSQNMKMPKLIYGTAWKKELTADLVEQAVLSGFGGIDTACQPKHYEEPLVGEALGKLYTQGIRREELFIQTKFTPLSGQDPNRIPYNPSATIEAQIAQSFEVSKKNLQTEYVDSLLLHSPLFPYTNLKKAWEALENIHDSGQARQIGISNCYDLELLIRLYDDAKVKPTVIQNRFYSESGYDKELRKWCDGHEIVYQGFWTLTANPYILTSQTVLSLAKKYHKTQAQIFYRFLSHIGIIPLIGSTSKVHIYEDLNIFEFELTKDETDSISTFLL
jgi:diketogulonate reductase-like aldo/keto reductase